MAEQPKQKDKAAELGQQVRDRQEEALKSPEYLAWQELLDELQTRICSRHGRVPEYLAWQELLQELLDELCNDLKDVSKDVSCDRIDAGAVGKLERILIGGKALQEHTVFDIPSGEVKRVTPPLLAAELTVTAMILVEECKQKITAVAQSLGWSISDIRTLFEPTGSFAWQALRAAAEAQTVGSSPRKAGRDRLVTVKEVAEYLRIHRNSMRTRTWPVAAVKHKGNQPDRYCWSELRPVLEQQYPDEDWGSF